MGGHLSSIGWYKTYLFELEGKCQEFNRKIDPLSESLGMQAIRK